MQSHQDTNSIVNYLPIFQQMPLEDLKNDYDDMYFPGPCEVSYLESALITMSPKHFYCRLTVLKPFNVPINMCPHSRGETDPRELYSYVLMKWRRSILEPSHRDHVGSEMIWSFFALLCRNNGVGVAVCVMRV